MRTWSKAVLWVGAVMIAGCADLDVPTSGVQNSALHEQVRAVRRSQHPARDTQVWSVSPEAQDIERSLGVGR